MSVDWQRELEQLQGEGEALQRATEDTQRELFELLAIPEVGRVSLVLDAKGLISDVIIDPLWRDSLSADEFVQEVNYALLRVSGLFAAGPLAATRPTSFLEKVMASFNSPASREPQEISNDFKTLTVTAMLGNVASVQADHRWIAQTPDALIAEEIVRIARIAALQTDTFGRYTS